MNDDIRELYQDLILDHGRTPRNKRKLAAHSHEALGHNPLCGDKITVYLSLGGDGKITDAAFEGQGCAISTASASIMTDMVKGKTGDETQRLFDYVHQLCMEDGAAAPAGLGTDDTDRLQALGGVRHFPVRVKCATLAWHTLQAALNNRKDAVKTEDV